MRTKAELQEQATEMAQKYNGYVLSETLACAQETRDEMLANHNYNVEEIEIKIEIIRQALVLVAANDGEPI